MNNIVLIGSDQLGSGDSSLGELLLNNFLRLLCSQHILPERIILWNSAVKAASQTSENSKYLLDLQARGVKIVLCGTCVDFYDIRESLAVGEISTMPAIQQLLLEGSVLTI